VEHSAELAAQTVSEYVVLMVQRLRQSVHTELPILVLVDAPKHVRAELELSKLSDLAREADCVVAVTEWIDPEEAGRPSFAVTRR
jgi:hypothetical protein